MRSARNSLTALVVGTALAVTACGTDLPLAPEGLALNVRAEVLTIFQGWFPLTPPAGGVPNVCTGENVLLSGEFHLIVRQVTSGSGHIQFQVHVSGSVRGVGAVSGMEYVSNEVTNLTQTAGPTGAAVFHLGFHIHTISKGSADNSSGVSRIQVTVNANGVVTVDKQSFEFDTCRG